MVNKHMFTENVTISVITCILKNMFVIIYYRNDKERISLSELLL